MLGRHTDGLFLCLANGTESTPRSFPTQRWTCLRMNRKSRAALWMGSAFTVAFALAVAVVGFKGVNPKGIATALQVTARWSFVLFWPAYTGSAMTALSGSAFKVISERGREFGLAYASAHLVHVGLVAWLYRLSPQPPVSQASFLFFGVGIVCTYSLAVFSIGRLSGLLGAGLWRTLRMVALNYIAAAFFADFIVNPLQRGIEYWGILRILWYLPFAILVVVGPVMRVVASTRRPALRSAPV
jgi:hypothetical protein